DLAPLELRPDLRRARLRIHPEPRRGDGESPGAREPQGHVTTHLAEPCKGRHHTLGRDGFCHPVGAGSLANRYSWSSGPRLWTGASSRLKKRIHRQALRAYYWLSFRILRVFHCWLFFGILRDFQGERASKYGLRKWLFFRILRVFHC